MCISEYGCVVAPRTGYQRQPYLIDGYGGYCRIRRFAAGPSGAMASGEATIMCPWSPARPSFRSKNWAESRPTGVAQGTAGIGRRPGIRRTRYRLISARSTHRFSLEA